MRTDETLERLRALIAAEGEALAPVLAAPGAEPVIGPLVLACAGDRPEAAELALVLESILEGYLLHYGQARLIDTADADLRLLAGDHMYAVGLSRLARLGDLDAVRALANLISLCAQAHAGAEADRATSRTGPLWLLTGMAVGAGRRPDQGGVLDGPRALDAGPEELLSAARLQAAALGVELEAQAALIAFSGAVADRPHG
jgi:hypothetical protein